MSTATIIYVFTLKPCPKIYFLRVFSVCVIDIYLENNPKQIRALIGTRTELARAVDVMMAFLVLPNFHPCFYYDFYRVILRPRQLSRIEIESE